MSKKKKDETTGGVSQDPVKVQCRRLYGDLQVAKELNDLPMIQRTKEALQRTESKLATVRRKRKRSRGVVCREPVGQITVVIQADPSQALDELAELQTRLEKR